ACPSSCAAPRARPRSRATTSAARAGARNGRVVPPTLVHRDGSFGAARLVPNAEAHLGIVGEVARDAECLAFVTRVSGAELHELPPQCRPAPRTETKALLHATAASTAGVHALSLH